MQFRAETEDREGGRVLHLAGRLEGAHVDDIRRVCARMSGAVSLELSGLLSADDAALGLLVELAGLGVPLIGASPYLTLQLDLVRERGLRHPRSVEEP